MTHAKILLVEDEKPVAEDVEERLQSLGHTVCATVPCGSQVIEKSAEMGPDPALIGLGSTLESVP